MKMPMEGGRSPSQVWARSTAQDYLDSLGSAAIVIDDEDIVVAANACACELAARDLGEIVGKPASGVFRQLVDRTRRAEPDDEGHIHFEHHVAGTWYVIRLYLVAGSAEKGGLLRVIAATDVSVRKATEFEIRENEARLEEATRIAQLGTYK